MTSGCPDETGMAVCTRHSAIALRAMTSGVSPSSPRRGSVLIRRQLEITERCKGDSQIAPTISQEVRSVPYDPQEHHRRSIRLARYDYSEAGSYFVTICTERRVCLFGEVREDRVELSESGMIVERSWKQMPQRFLNTRFGFSCRGPTNVHGIILISSPAPVSVGRFMNRPFSDRANATPRTPEHTADKWSCRR